MAKKLFTQIDPKDEYVFAKVYEWTAPDRHWEPRSRAWYVVYSFFFTVLIAIAALIGEYILIVAIIAFVFLWFVQASIPPEIMKHVITNIGIKTHEKLYKWKDIMHFWFSIKDGVKVLNLVIKPSPGSKASPKTISILLNNEEQDDELFRILINNVDYGDTDEIGYNIISQLIHGRHLDISTYLPEDQIDLFEGIKKGEEE